MMSLDTKGNTFLVQGSSTTWGWGGLSNYEVVAKVNGKDIPLYYNPFSIKDGSKQPIVKAYLGEKTGPIAAEVTSDNKLTVVFEGGYTLDWGKTISIYIEKFDLSTGVSESRYNFKTKKFDLIKQGDLFWTDKWIPPDHYRARYISESHPLYKPQELKVFNKSYYQALKDFKSVLSPSQTITTAKAGADTLTGTSNHKDIFKFDGTPEFGIKKDTIINFSVKDKDILQFNKRDFGLTKTPTFAVAATKKSLDNLLIGSTNFVYFQPNGELIFNANGKLSGTGDSGGVFAALTGNPILNSSSLSFL